ncbi:vacuolar protein sorting-associated protein 37D [Brienomyrus brachyistius]|uniref:vacuolar protein sorting-associated protein 37D n=1 Tax=Brienomyrus brachyistius TaxID=42636 RepID=UPI0020B1FFBA|nr:vacuolar protein sorting-associated protein 37D [Brienomyrus brachyistius]
MSHKRDPNSNPDGFSMLNTSELRDLLQDEGKIDQIVKLSEKFQELHLARDILLTTNRSLAEESLSLRPRLQNGKLQLAQKYQELEKLSSGCRDKQRQLEGYAEKHSLHTAQNLLQEDMTHTEVESEDLLEKFMEGTVPLEGFLESFQRSRKTYHVRRAQTEKIQEFTKAERNARKHSAAPEEKLEPLELRANGFVAQAPPRVFQLRYGLTPAIILPRCPPGSSHGSIHAVSLPPLDTRLGQSHSQGPGAPHACPGQPVGLRVIGQIPGWPIRPMRLQQLYRPGQHQPEPPCR